MEIWFTYNNTVGSKLIRWALNEPVSHVAIKLESGIIVHSKFFEGVTIDWALDFKRHNTVYDVYNTYLSPTQERIVLANVLNQYADKSYDYGAFAYFCWRVFLNKAFARPYPSRFKLASNRKFICTELAERFLGTTPSTILSPYKLLQQLKGTHNGWIQH
jgi:hypothetical protein